ncbi:transcription elongation factor spt4 [Tulasnella sp. 419]|nr:transcription elongation factor spt4 [Tulasnella sp. 418]KAG8967606.1 transcription elongation factor spt4 [Tulasnella sp. 419]
MRLLPQPPEHPISSMNAPAGAIPGAKKQLRACLLCSIIQTPQDFKRLGCPNCDEILQIQNDSERVASCTSAQFDGVIALTNPGESWVARWQRTDNFVRGLYAIRVTGRLPVDVQDALAVRGYTYRPRDQVQEL